MAAEKRLGLLLAHALNCVACMHLRLEWGEIFKNHCHSHMGGSQNYGPLLGRHYIAAPYIQGYQNGTLILGTPPHMPLHAEVFVRAEPCLREEGVLQRILLRTTNKAHCPDGYTGYIFGEWKRKWNMLILIGYKYIYGYWRRKWKLLFRV